MKKETLIATVVLTVIFTVLVYSCKKNDSTNNNTTNYCAHTSCLNGGTPTVSGTSCYCSCQNGDTGDSCQSNVFGTYSGQLVNTQNGGTTNATMIITGGVGGTTFNINYGGNFTANWSGSVNSFSFVVNSQTQGGLSISGGGSFELGYFNFNFSQTTGGVTNNYDFAGLK